MPSPGIGINTDVQASGGDHWWTVPVLILSAAQNALLEEIVMIGFLFTRLRQLGWNAAAIVAFSAIIRGSYHLYQGIGGFVGNLIMGVIFGLIYLRWKRVGLLSSPIPCWTSPLSWDMPWSHPRSIGFDGARPAT